MNCESNSNKSRVFWLVPCLDDMAGCDLGLGFELEFPKPKKKVITQTSL